MMFSFRMYIACLEIILKLHKKGAEYQQTKHDLFPNPHIYTIYDSIVFIDSFVNSNKIEQHFGFIFVFISFKGAVSKK